MDVRELARRLNQKYPTRDWDQQCQRLIWNAIQQIHGLSDAQMVTYPTAAAARLASSIVSTNAAAAPAGAIHYWRNPAEGHVGVALGGGRVLMTGTLAALGAGGEQLGRNFGITTVDAYTRARSNPYLGWARTNGRNRSIEGRIGLSVGQASSTSASRAQWRAIQSSLRKLGRYTGPVDGVPGINTWKGIQTTVRLRAGYTGPVDGVPGPNTYRGMQLYARDGGGYTGPIDGVLGPNSWAGFVRRLSS